MGERTNPGEDSRRGLTRRELVTGIGGIAAGGVLGGLGGIALGQGPLGGEERVAEGGPAGPPVLIGSSVPLSGFASGDGEDMMRGFAIALDEINARGGICGRPLQHKALDAGEFAPDVMVNNFKRLITEFEVDAIIGGYQTNTGPELDIVADADMLYYHNNTIEANAETVRNNPEKYWGVFQHDPTEVWYSRSLPGFLDRVESTGAWKPPNHNVAIINANNSYSAGLTKEFNRQIQGTHWRIGLIEEVVAPNQEWGPTLAKIRRDIPGVIWVTDYFPSDDASFMKQFVQDPTPSLIHMQYGPSVPEFLDLAQEAGNGVLWASVIAIIQDELGKRFTTEYQNRFKQRPGFSQGGATYDSTLIYATAAALAGGPEDRRKVAEVTRSLIFRGVTGGRRFDPQDQTNRPYPTDTKDPSVGMPTQYFQIQNGEHIVIDPSPFTTGEFQPLPWRTGV
jgi:branched-chain amino acid transport system substrate-binding protein